MGKYTKIKADGGPIKKVRISDKGIVEDVPINTSKYKKLYDSKTLAKASSDPNLLIAAQDLNPVEVTANKSRTGLFKEEAEKEYPISKFRTDYFPSWGQPSPLDKLPQHIQDAYDKRINDLIAEKLLKSNPSFDEDYDKNRLQALGQFSPNELNILKNSNLSYKVEPSIWQKLEQGALSLNAGPVQFKNPNLTQEEAKDENHALNLFGPLNIPYNATVGRLYSNQLGDDYSIKKALQGKSPAHENLAISLLGDPLNYMGVGLMKGAGKLPGLSKLFKTANKFGDVLTTKTPLKYLKNNSVLDYSSKINREGYFPHYDSSSRAYADYSNSMQNEFNILKDKHRADFESKFGKEYNEKDLLSYAKQKEGFNKHFAGPLEDEYHDVTRQFIKTQGTKQLDDINQINAVDDYTSGLYRGFNNTERPINTNNVVYDLEDGFKIKPHNQQYYNEHINPVLQNAILQNKLKRPTALFRGMSTDAPIKSVWRNGELLPENSVLYEDLLPGDEYLHDKFVSTGLHPVPHFGLPSEQSKIIAPKGQSYAFPNASKAKRNPSEMEIILPQKLRFKVNKKLSEEDRIKNGYLYEKSIVNPYQYGGYINNNMNNNYADGGPIKGKKKPTIKVNDLNDPGLIAHNDSLALYNAGILQDKTGISAAARDSKTTTMSKNYATNSLNYLLSNYGTTSTGDDDKGAKTIDKLFKKTKYKPIGVNEYGEEGSTFIFKKPERSYEYSPYQEKLNINSIPINGSTNRNTMQGMNVSNPPTPTNPKPWDSLQLYSGWENLGNQGSPVGYYDMDGSRNYIGLDEYNQMNTPQYSGGGPIRTNNPNDPMLLAYNDSLNTYNNGTASLRDQLNNFNTARTYDEFLRRHHNIIGNSGRINLALAVHHPDVVHTRSWGPQRINYHHNMHFVKPKRRVEYIPYKKTKPLSINQVPITGTTNSNTVQGRNIPTPQSSTNPKPYNAINLYTAHQNLANAGKPIGQINEDGKWRDIMADEYNAIMGSSVQGGTKLENTNYAMGGRMNQAQMLNQGKMRMGSGEGNGLREYASDYGNFLLDGITGVAEGITGAEIYNPNYNTKLGKIAGAVNNQSGKMIGKFAPMALNAVAPGVGTAVGVAGKAIGTGLNASKDEQSNEQSNAQLNLGNNSMLPNVLGNNMEGIAQMETMGAAQSFSFKQGGLMHINEGGTHEQNALGGVPIGPNALVEQGETINNDFVFSDRLKPKGSKRTYAQLSKSVDTKYKLRPDDKLSKEAKQMDLDRLAMQQEAQKDEMSTKYMQKAMACGGKIKGFGGQIMGPISQSMNVTNGQTTLLPDGGYLPNYIMDDAGRVPKSIDNDLRHKDMLDYYDRQAIPTSLFGIYRDRVDELGIDKATEEYRRMVEGQQSLANGGMISNFMEPTPQYYNPADLDNQYAHGGSIHIKPENRGKFTASANRAGMGVQEFASHVLANKEDYSSTQVKRANFARNFGGKKHAMGGNMYGPGGPLEDFSYADINLPNYAFNPYTDMPQEDYFDLREPTPDMAELSQELPPFMGIPGYNIPEGPNMENGQFTTGYPKLQGVQVNSYLPKITTSNTVPLNIPQRIQRGNLNNAPQELNVQPYNFDEATQANQIQKTANTQNPYPEVGNTGYLTNLAGNLIKAGMVATSKPPIYNPSVKLNRLNPTAAERLAMQEGRREIQGTKDIIRNNATSSGQYLTNASLMGSNAANKLAGTIGGIRQQYDTQNVGIGNQEAQVNQQITAANNLAKETFRDNRLNQYNKILDSVIGANQQRFSTDEHANNYQNQVVEFLKTKGFRIGYKDGKLQMLDANGNVANIKTD
jgi:hypothetical protein